MRITSILSEAGRDLRTGASRAGVFALAITCTGTVLGLADALSVERLSEQAADYRASGASVWITDAEDMVNGAACDRMAEVEGVRGSGALRTASEPIVFASTPDADVTVLQVTPGLL